MVNPTSDPSDLQDEVDLTDNQIQQLLLEAEGRLRGPVQATPASEDVALRFVFLAQ